MWRYFTHANTFRYVDVLNKLLSSYNDTYHRTIRTVPSKVNKENEAILWNSLHGLTIGKPSSGKFKVGDKVRISKSVRSFAKGYLPNWTEEIFVIATDLMTYPSTYKLRDATNELIEGSFYEFELQKVVKADDVYVIKKIIDTRKRGRSVKYLVKWRGYPDKFNSWIKQRDLVKDI